MNFLIKFTKIKGYGKNESYNNLELVVTPKKEKRYASYKIYVANFNKDEEDDKVFTHITEKTIIKPAEKKNLKTLIMTRGIQGIRGNG